MKLLALLLLFGSLQMMATTVVPDEMQQINVTGRVTDESGNALPGVNIVEKGTTNGAITSSDGTYSLRVASSTSVLTFSFIGYITQEVTVGNQTTVDITLAEAVSTLEEIVVVGYTTQIRKNLSGSVSTVSAEELTVSTAPSAVSRLQGQASGVTVTTSNRPGGEPTIRIRGIGTINDPDPLYIIDGVPASPGNNLNPNDIESISILKDAASSAIYGSRGANGVIIITTKRGRLNQAPTIEVSARTGITQATNKYDLLNTQEYAEAVWLYYRNRGLSPSHAQYGSGATPEIPDYILPAGAREGNSEADPSNYFYPDRQIYRANQTGTDWYDEIYRNGPVSEFDMSVRGGGQNSTYSFSGNYLDENGMLKYTNFKRYTFRMNSDTKFNDWFKVGESLQVIYINQKGNLDDNGEGTVISQAYRSQPIIPVYDIMGNFAGSRAPEMGNSGNPVAMLYRARNNTGKWTRAMGNFYGELAPLPGLTVRSLFGYNYGQWNAKNYTIPNYEHSEPNRVNGLSIETNNTMQWNWTNTVNYITKIGNDHNLNVVIGTEAIASQYEEANASRSQYFLEDPDYMQLDVGDINKDNSGTGNEWSLFSYFGRVNYDFMGRYLIEATFRRDGSSRFSPEHRYGNFPAVSAGWTISEEGFMAGTSNWLNFLKFRVGWGLSGNDRIGEYNAFSTYASDSYTAAYAIDGSNTAAIVGFQPSTVGNEDVTWEATRTMNIGIDAQLLNNNLTFAFDVWNRRTRDMLYRLQIPEVMGLAQAPYLNIGEMANRGFDLELGYRNIIGSRFRYNVKATISHYRNEILKLSDNQTEEIIAGGERQMNYTRATIGTSFPEFYGYEVEGIFQTPAEAARHPAYGTTDYNAPGHLKFRNQLTIDSDGDGVMDRADSIINPDDMVYIGNPHPDLTGGLNIDLGYGSFDLNMFFYTSIGNDMINYVTRWIDYGMFNGGLSKDALYRSWGSPYLEGNNETARLPMLDYNDISQQPSTAFIEDGSFLRLKTLRLGYTFPSTMLQKLQIKNVLLYAQVTNLFTITKYRGLDPELNSSGDNMGMDRGAWPTPRQIMFGINFSL